MCGGGGLFRLTVERLGALDAVLDLGDLAHQLLGRSGGHGDLYADARAGGAIVHPVHAASREGPPRVRGPPTSIILPCKLGRRWGISVITAVSVKEVLRGRAPTPSAPDPGTETRTRCLPLGSNSLLKPTEPVSASRDLREEPNTGRGTFMPGRSESETRSHIRANNTYLDTSLPLEIGAEGARVGVGSRRARYRAIALLSKRGAPSSVTLLICVSRWAISVPWSAKEEKGSCEGGERARGRRHLPLPRSPA